MPAQIFGGRLHGNIRTQVEGTLQIRGHEGVIHHQQGTVTMRNFGDLRDITHLQGGVGGAFPKNHLDVIGKVIVAESAEIAHETDANPTFR